MFRYLVLLALLAFIEAKKDYTGHRLISVKAKNRIDVEFLHQLEEDVDLELDFWTDPSLVRATNIRVPPGSFGRLRGTLKRAGLEFQVVKENIQEWIAADEKSRSAKSSGESVLTDYPKYDKAVEFMSQLSQAYPGRVQLQEFGTSYEGRPLYGVLISSDPYQNKRLIVVEATTHAREWLAGTTALHLINELATNTPDGEAMLKDNDWFIVPYHNADGYEYSYVSDRLWRKNRQYTGHWAPWCYGIDLNRNWDANHGGPGSSNSTCSDTYNGGSAFSAPETRNLKNKVEEFGSRVFAFFSIHCYSQFMLIPYGYKEAKPADYKELKAIGEDMMEALKAVDGSKFLTGTPPDLLYVASGGAYDHWYDHGVKYSFTYELRPDQSDGRGFIMGKSEILPTARETIASLKRFTEITDLQ